MRVRTFGHLTREAIVGTRKNGAMTFASILTTCLSLLILATFLLLAINMGYIARTVQSQVEIVAYLQKDFDRALLRDDLMAKVRSIDGVAEATFVTREQALQRLDEQFGEDSELLEAVGEMNPLVDEVDIRVPDPGRVEAVAAEVEALQSVDSASYPKETVERLYALTRNLQIAGVAVVAGLGLITLLLIANTVRLTVLARRRDIAVQRLIGASNGFIRLPFFLQGALLGLTGSALAAGLVWWGYRWTFEAAASTLPFLPLAPPQPLLINVAKVLIALGLLIGAFGSAISVRRHLRV